MKIMLMKSMSSVCLVVAALALSACQTTIVEHLPQGAKTECPAAVFGAWIAVEDDGQDASDFGLLVHRDCTLESRGTEGAHPSRPPLPHLQFFSAAGKDLAFIATPDAYELGEVKPDDTSNAKAGFMLFAWQRHGDLLELQAPDHRHVANLIVNGAVHGRTQWNNEDQLASVYNFLAGDEAAIAQLLLHTDLFGDVKVTRLRHVGGDDKALNRALRSAKSRTAKAGKDSR